MFWRERRQQQVLKKGIVASLMTRHLTPCVIFLETESDRTRNAPRSPCFLPSFTLSLLKDDRPFSSGWKERRCRPPQCKVDEEQLWKTRPSRHKSPWRSSRHSQCNSFFSFFLFFIYPHSIRILWLYWRNTTKLDNNASSTGEKRSLSRLQNCPKDFFYWQ